MINAKKTRVKMRDTIWINGLELVNGTCSSQFGRVASSGILSCSEITQAGNPLEGGSGTSFDDRELEDAVVDEEVVATSLLGISYELDQALGTRQVVYNDRTDHILEHDEVGCVGNSEVDPAIVEDSLRL